MTGRGRPPRDGSRPPAKPKGFEDAPELSAEEVERRVEVRGGGTPVPPVQRAVRRAPPPRRQERTVARDSLLLIGLVIVGLVAVSFLLPNGPLSASATTAPGTQAAVGSSASPTTAPPTQAGPTPTPTPIIVVDPSLDFSPPPTAAPTATPPATPGPTPKATPKPTPGPTPPGTATVIVRLHVITDSGGSPSAMASDWTMTITGSAASGASSNNFPGSESGTAVTIPAGKDYSIFSNNARTDYAAYGPSVDCHRASGRGLAGGTTVTCTVTRNDRPRVRVVTHVITDDGGSASASDWTVSIPGANATPSTFNGSEAGTVVVVGFGLTYDVSMSGGPSDYTLTKAGQCGPTSLGLDDPATTCTFTFDDPTPAPTVPKPALPIAFLPFVLPRRWRPIRRR